MQPPSSPATQTSTPNITGTFLPILSLQASTQVPRFTTSILHFLSALKSWRHQAEQNQVATFWDDKWGLRSQRFNHNLKWTKGPKRNLHTCRLACSCSRESVTAEEDNKTKHWGGNASALLPKNCGVISRRFITRAEGERRIFQGRVHKSHNAATKT